MLNVIYDDNSWKFIFPILINFAMSTTVYFLTIRLIPKIKDMFVKANLYGIDMNKRSGEKVPEALGVVTGCLFLITLFLFIPVPFTNYIFNDINFPHNEFMEFLAALLSICCMLLLGFADDVLDLRWRHKLLLPTIASLPLLMVYYINFNSTLIIVPKPLRPWFGLSVDLWVFYYLYMGMLAVFCTNAINILAGINGLEVGQSLVISISILLFNIIELSGDLWKAHQFSLYFMLPYIATSLGLLKFNWYPAQVFVGDTFCYLSGMTFAVVGIIGHFSKTTLLFFIPQIINFLYSVPQLFHLIPCPRHRLPKYNKKTDKLDISTTVFNKKDIGSVGKFIAWIFRKLNIIKWQEDDQGIVTCNNLTLINFVLINTGPMNEPTLTLILLLIQVVSSSLAFLIRYPLASIFYEV
ncbi:UDP-N-acetylglucosamine--dolichyl-phosphate N-acetylglucosaminephosphotransferase isoform X1 [Bombus vosnesenskii]|uniref:UDP-N-acetylglucosamine--dolichyl-phosphate N-acetylglucosaminephosphotransferase n=2 Tax=Pyrobombus TaxID=144703 RepID=A0A6J3LQD4_9HYME|nr:UDP-N-acetylglucosamine--dolichyl-phosphate N-acetylglucosaminephosphotransferase isoform X1 [Bombus impatiens]XP_033366209.1 UDP-N-acetylglucosamine--dolichyl-phosphate N-acetylglucosaminephosphotransferase isoform X1 [Bombus vosnesenskii]XP_050491488.1 UDP-N-acetylglucosamine--dolichyl-phosphate N-acetylglucosaminephosphotransferase [Bombus huntii]